MESEPKAISHPELVIGIAGPIGIDIEALADEIARALKDVNYTSHSIRVTQEMTRFPAPGVAQHGADYFNTMMFKMDYANKLCEDAGDAAFVIRTAVQAIAFAREQKLSEHLIGPLDPQAQQQVIPSVAFIIRQMKRPSEVDLLRRIYGKQFVLVSAYGNEQERRE